MAGQNFAKGKISPEILAVISHQEIIGGFFERYLGNISSTKPRPCLSLISLRNLARLKRMKKDIHPKYYPNTQIRCACGNIFTVGSTKEHMEGEICSSCHPFYTGKEKLMDALGRVEKFKKRLSKKGVSAKKKGK